MRISDWSSDVCSSDLTTMATDYDASRKTEEEQKEESHEARRLTSGEQDKTSGKIDVDETELAESFELPGADLSNETRSIEVVPKQLGRGSCRERVCQYVVL